MTARKSRIKKKDLLQIIGADQPEPTKHPLVSGVTMFGDKSSFPISWLQKKGYCEYQLYLEHFRKIRARPTMAMITGSKEHHRLEAEFLEGAEETTFADMLTDSLTTAVYSREFPVLSLEHGIHGVIDEILFTTDRFIIIDDKPGNKVYDSNIFQVYGYCLCFKEMIGENHEGRQIYAALRERGTDNIYWQVPFDQDAEEMAREMVARVHRLITLEEDFTSAQNPNKCQKCRFYRYCDRRL